MNTLPINISNAGVGTLTITDVTADVPWLSFTSTSSGGVAPFTLTAMVDRTGLSDGVFLASIAITSDAGQGSQTQTSVFR